MTKITKTIIFTVFFISISFFVSTYITSASYDYTTLENIPGSEETSSDLTAFLKAIYKFAIWSVGIAAVFMLTIGGFMYMTSAGNNAKAESAKRVITDSIIGLVIALSAYLLLYVINPDLVKISVTLKKIGGTGTTAPSTIPQGTATACNGTNSGCCKTGTTCQDCLQCVDFTNNYPNLCYKGATGNTGCKLNSTIATKIASANLDSVNAEVSEAWPPTVTHSDSCHAVGTCADIRCKSGCSNLSVTEIKKIYDTLKNSGLSVVYESSNCTPYSAVGINCNYYSTTTGASFHAE